ncbi:MobA/MobL family protein [Shewanella electrodiphila]|uniref:MobA/MobL family protein n=1 Tax=Shewanella electrodiphila TaxID=934143 RepID=A0ABT0KVR6_9GAMM|nr:MobA/MobL family protein [Shewanella electrodiphila]MCL1047953.1 MobA/MobL family protein [Shewanella electrodiphila]
MAIFIASTKSISRGSGQSAVASASYRAGCELEDKRYGKTHDYSKKQGVMSADIILPTALAAANAEISRSELWNKAEDAEKRVDARVAREWLVNLPHELSEQDRKELAHTFAQTLADRYGTIADCAIHEPTQKEIDRGADPRNFHAHILFTTRTAELDDSNEIILTDKASIELSDNKRRSLGMARVSHEIKDVRQIWEQIANEKLAEHNLNLIDSRSYAAQGIDIEPQLKMGSVATKLERDKYERELRKAEQAKEEGKHYEIDKTPATQLGTINEIINERNELVWGVELTKNQIVNDAADAIILNGHKIKDIEHTTSLPSRTTVADEPIKKPEPTSAPKPKAPTLDAVAKAMAMAKGVATRKADEQKQKELALEQQRQHELAEQQKREQAERERIEQARADRARQQQAIAEQLERESQQFMVDKKALYAAVMAQLEQHTQKGIDPDSKVGKPILSISVANEITHSLNQYMDNPDTTQRQRELALNERTALTDLVNDKSTQALSEIKNLHYTSDRKTHTAALQDVLTEFADNHGQSIDKSQEKALESAQKAISDYSNEINRSRSYGLGR